MLTHQATALADTIFGVSNPGGKLPLTMRRQRPPADILIGITPGIRTLVEAAVKPSAMTRGARRATQGVDHVPAPGLDWRTK